MPHCEIKKAIVQIASFHLHKVSYADYKLLRTEKES